MTVKPAMAVLATAACSDDSGTVCAKYLMPGTRDQFKRRTSQTALNTLRKRVLEHDHAPTAAGG